MDLSRRDFLERAAGTLTGTALGGRRRRRKRHTTPDALGLGVERELLERLVAEDPDPDELDGWLLTQCLERSEPHGAGAVRAMAL